MVAEQVAAAAAAAKAKTTVKQRGVSGSHLRAPADEVGPAKVRAAGLGHRARPTHPTPAPIRRIARDGQPSAKAAKKAEEEAVVAAPAAAASVPAGAASSRPPAVLDVSHTPGGRLCKAMMPDAPLALAAAPAPAPQQKGGKKKKKKKK